MAERRPQRSCKSATASTTSPEPKYTDTTSQVRALQRLHVGRRILTHTEASETFTKHSQFEKQIGELKICIQQLHADNAALYSGYESLLGEFIELHLDMPNAWSLYIFENYHRHRLPESVMLDLRANLKYLEGRHE